MRIVIQQKQKRLKSGFKTISQTVQTLEGSGSIVLPALHPHSPYDFDLRATRARTLLPEALASVSFGFAT